MLELLLEEADEEEGSLLPQEKLSEEEGLDEEEFKDEWLEDVVATSEEEGEEKDEHPVRTRADRAIRIRFIKCHLFCGYSWM